MTLLRSMSMAAAFAALLAAAPLSALAGASAPQPARPVDAGKLFTGRWLEIARLPLAIAKGCVAAYTEYETDASGKLFVTEACHAGSPKGSLRSVKSHGVILDPGTNAKLRVHYPFLISWDFWILDHADDYSWYISGDPDHQRLFVFTRAAPDPATRAALVERVKTLGYDASRLEYPELAPQ